MTLKSPLPPLMVPVDVVPSPQLIVAEYALAVALVFGSLMVATMPPTEVPAVLMNEKSPVGTVSSIVVFVRERLQKHRWRDPGEVHSIPMALSELTLQLGTHVFGNDALQV